MSYDGHGELPTPSWPQRCSRAAGSAPRPWWSPAARLAFARGSLPRPLLAGAAHLLEKSGGLLGARDVAGRLPFLYRSTHMDSTGIREAIGEQLHDPGGASSAAAVRSLVLGILNGGPQAINQRRYRLY